MIASAKSLFGCCFTFLLLSTVTPAVADDGQLIAVRHWPQHGISIETMWDLSVGLGIDDRQALPNKLDFELSNVQPDTVATVLRLPNESKTKIHHHPIDPQTGDIAEQLPSGPQSNVVVIVRRKGVPFLEVYVGGTTVLIFTELPTADGFSDKTMLVMKRLHESCVVVDLSRIAVDDAVCQKIIDVIHPTLMIVPSSITSVAKKSVQAVDHNTVAYLSPAQRPKQSRLVSLGDQPYKMQDEVAELFAKKEAACKASQEFFAGLSVGQMNFKPNNGTHTPRWNPEHMMGRELLFFSQIYHAVDPTIPVMNLNPKQMPQDYQFAHPDWTGAEEARQMHRVEAFTRRFAYLLGGLNLDKRAPGSRFWTPRKLLLQMDRHYSEHTANVKKKMQLPGWPVE